MNLQLDAKHALTALTRIAQRRAEVTHHLTQALAGGRLNQWAAVALEVAVETGDPIGLVLADRLRTNQDLKRAAHLLSIMPAPGRTVALLEVGALLSRQLLDGIQAQTGSPFQETVPGLKEALALWLRCLGQVDQALDLLQEAVLGHRELARTQPDVYRPVLAQSLHNLAGMLSQLKRDEQALAAAQEAVSEYRELSRVSPNVFRADLLASLSNLSTYFRRIGQRDTALATAQEAVSGCGDLEQASSQSALSLRSFTLLNLTQCLADAGQQEEALVAAREAVTIDRMLASMHPDAFVASLAASLNILAGVLSAAGRPEQALEAAQESVSVNEKLAKGRPHAYRIELARSLSNRAASFHSLDMREEALAAAQEALEHYRVLTQTEADRFRPELATVLNNLAGILCSVGREELGLAAAEESVVLRRALAQAQPHVFLPELALSLNTLAVCSNRSSRRRDIALRAAEESVELLAPYFAESPTAFGGRMRRLGASYMMLAREGAKSPRHDLVAVIGTAFEDESEHDEAPGQPAATPTTMSSVDAEREGKPGSPQEPRANRPKATLWRRLLGSGRQPARQTHLQPDSSSGILTSFPGMPLLTMNVRNRLRRYLPNGTLYLKRDNERISQGDSDAYVVFVDTEQVGRFTIRTSGLHIERNFFCKLATDTVLPDGAVEEGSFGVGDYIYFDRFRVIAEHIQAICWHVSRRVMHHEGDSSAANVARVPNGSPSKKGASLRHMYVQYAKMPDLKITISTEVCAADGKPFSVPSQYVTLLSPHPEEWLVDIGGYCIGCARYLCPDHLELKLVDEAACTLYCRRCSIPVFAQMPALTPRLRALQRIEAKLQSNDTLSEEEALEINAELESIRQSQEREK